MKVTMLGCGSSAGVPLIGCDCNVCTSNNPKNKRTRVSAFVETEHTNILIDTSPDLRQQALRHGIRKVDAVLYTHEHADHLNGIDDLRSFNYLSGEALPIYSNEETIGFIKERFPYVFLPKPVVWFRPCLIPHTLPNTPAHSLKIQDISITCFEQVHGKYKTLGYRIGDFAYSVDTNEIPDSAFEALKGVEVWFVDCLRYSDAPSHANLDKTLQWIERVKPKLAVLTHMAHEFDYDTLAKELPPGVVPGYDGLMVDMSKKGGYL